MKYVNAMYSFSPQVHCYETCQNSYKIVKSKITADITPLFFSFTEIRTQRQNNTALSLKTLLTTSQKWPLLMISLQEVSPPGILQQPGRYPLSTDTFGKQNRQGLLNNRIWGRGKGRFLKKENSKIGT